MTLACVKLTLKKQKQNKTKPKTCCTLVMGDFPPNDIYFSWINTLMGELHHLKFYPPETWVRLKAQTQNQLVCALLFEQRQEWLEFRLQKQLSNKFGQGVNSGLTLHLRAKAGQQIIKVLRKTSLNAACPDLKMSRSQERGYSLNVGWWLLIFFYDENVYNNLRALFIVFINKMKYSFPWVSTYRLDVMKASPSWRCNSAQSCHALGA